mmetsp:Transcript_10032/g.15264  ORF Transcript_10032/g.15264 Transcript_10032/m.15264 type:complete len:164 (+) Transcript_10032:2097-2588(+)
MSRDERLAGLASSIQNSKKSGKSKMSHMTKSAKSLPQHVDPNVEVTLQEHHEAITKMQESMGKLTQRIKKMAEFKTHTTVDVHTLKKQMAVLYAEFEKDEKALIKSIMASSIKSLGDDISGRKNTATSTQRAKGEINQSTTPYPTSKPLEQRNKDLGPLLHHL